MRAPRRGGAVHGMGSSSCNVHRPQVMVRDVMSNTLKPSRENTASNSSSGRSISVRVSIISFGRSVLLIVSGAEQIRVRTWRCECRDDGGGSGVSNSPFEGVRPVLVCDEDDKTGGGHTLLCPPLTGMCGRFHGLQGNNTVITRVCTPRCVCGHNTPSTPHPHNGQDLGISKSATSGFDSSILQLGRIAP